MPAHQALVKAYAIATRNLSFARQIAALPGAADDPDIMRLLAGAERAYARAMYAWKVGTPDYDEATPGRPGVP